MTTTTEATPTTEADATSDEPIDEIARLSGLPWASPDHAHEDPSAAVEAFMAFVRDLYVGEVLGIELELGEVTTGEFAAGDQRSGEVQVSFTEEVSAGPVLITPTITVFVRQSGPDDTWWVLGAVSDAIVVDEPSPHVTDPVLPAETAP